MWEQWNRFIDRFEIAASLSNICDPVKRSQILFLSMGEKLQRITRAARLRPSLEEPSCYAFFVRNIEGYLRSMVDVTAEHEAFTNLKQEANEPVMDFHSRLMEKVRLCDYSSADQERFVRAQLLKGMRNKELVKSARTFGYDTLFIVQSATREEAFMDESAQTEPSQALALTRNRPRTSGVARHWKQTNESTADRWTRPRRRETDEKRNRGLGRRSRCSKCDRLFHKFGSCPAVNSNCNKCGLRGHFAVVCRKKDANQLQVERNHEAEWESDRDAGKEINSISLADTLIDCRVGSSYPIRFLINSVSDVNTIGGDDWTHLKHEYQSGNAHLEPLDLSTGNLRSYASSKPISMQWAFKAEIEVVDSHKPTIVAVFYVVDQGSRSLLGRSTAGDLRLLQVGVDVNRCERIGQDTNFPKVPGVLVKFSVDPTVPPAKNAYYNVPAAYRESARLRLSEMEDQGIIERVTSAPGIES